MHKSINLNPWVGDSHAHGIEDSIRESLTRKGQWSQHVDDYKLCEELEAFPIDAIIHACLEYSKFSRSYTERQRIEYLIDKCKHYMSNVHTCSGCTEKKQLCYCCA
jgi:hypothetical protein